MTLARDAYVEGVIEGERRDLWCRVAHAAVRASEGPEFAIVVADKVLAAYDDRFKPQEHDDG